MGNKNKFWQYSLYSATLGLSLLGSVSIHNDKVYADSENPSYVNLTEKNKSYSNVLMPSALDHSSQSVKMDKATSTTYSTSRPSSSNKAETTTTDRAAKPASGDKAKATTNSTPKVSTTEKINSTENSSETIKSTNSEKVKSTTNNTSKPSSSDKPKATTTNKTTKPVSGDKAKAATDSTPKTSTTEKLKPTTSSMKNQPKEKPASAVNEVKPVRLLKVENPADKNEKMMADLNGLFKDNNHHQLASGVTGQQISKMKKRLESFDKNSEVYRNGMQLLNQAESLLDNWQFNGISDWHYGDMSFHNDGSNELDINVHGVPHPYYKDKTYAAIDVTDASGANKYKADIIGDKQNKIEETIVLKNGDVLHLFYAEPRRMICNKEDLKTDVLNSKDFYYRCENHKLVNITDYMVLNQQINHLFAGDKLAFGVAKKDIDNLMDSLNSAKDLMSKADFEKLLNHLSQAQDLMKKAQASGAVKNNQIQTKKLYSLDTSSIKQTNAEGRGMGTHHDRQNLGIILTKGSTFKIRQTNADFKGKLLLRLLGDDGKTEQHCKIINSSSDWTEITANDDLVVFIDTPTDTEGQATVEYEVTSGMAQKLPDFKLKNGVDASALQKQFMEEWDSTKAPFALIEGYNIQLLAPVNDFYHINKTDLKQLLYDYDGELFPLYDYLTGITPNKNYDDHIQGRYFIKADKHGAGAAYYGRNWSAFNGDSIGAYLTMNWLPWHEIGHGYEFGTRDTRITDVFNNVYGTMFQNHYTNDFKDKSSWLWHNNKINAVNNTIKLLNGGGAYAGSSYQQRLLILYNLLSYDNANVMIQVNKLNRELALEHSNLSGRIGTVSAMVYAQKYHLNVIPYLKWVGIPVDDTVASQIENQHYKVINSLCKMVPENQENSVAQSLGWNLDDSSDLWNRMSLVTSDQVDTAPEIQAENQEIEEGSKFDPMAHVSASDKEDGVLKDIKVTANDVNVNKPGVYHVTYEVTDKAGKSTTKTIEVTVKAKAAKTLPQLGDNDNSSKGMLMAGLSSITLAFGLLVDLIKKRIKK